MSSKTSHVSITTIGQDLMEHSKIADLDGKRGLVVELYPFIFGAQDRISARAISRYLKEKHAVKLSAVTIAKALNDPKKYWNQFFDTIESAVATYENFEPAEKREDFLYDDKSFKAVQFPGREILRKQLLKYEIAQAIDLLREKWFSIDYDTRVKARPYLAERLLGKVK